MFRLHGPGWITTREVARDVRLGGVDLVRGTDLMISPHVIHHSSDVYDEPERFDPDRWINRSVDHSTFVPFGHGARKCIAANLAHADVLMFLATAIARWRFTPVTTRPAKAIPGATMEPGDLRLRVHATAPPYGSGE